MDTNEATNSTTTTTATTTQMHAGGIVITEVLPKSGLLFSEKAQLTELLCQPKMLPIKSSSLEKLEAQKREMAKQPPITAPPAERPTSTSSRPHSQHTPHIAKPSPPTSSSQPTSPSGSPHVSHPKRPSTASQRS